MRVVSLHPARDPVPCGDGPVWFGSAPDNDIVPAGAGVESRHAMIKADARGLVLTVQPGCQRIYVNARAVRERALLRYGDSLTLGANKFVVTADVAPPVAGETAVAGKPAGPALLRIVSGAASGNALAIAPELRLGSGTRHFGGAGCGCRIVQVADGLVLETDGAQVYVNGWPCRRVRLSHGDQIVFGEHRLVVEAPGMEYAAHLASLPLPPAPEPEPVPDDATHTEIWWLVAAAAALAVVIAALLYFR